MSREMLVARWRGLIAQRGRCTSCGSARVWHNGIRWRKASLQLEGQTEYFGEIPVRRLRCGDCGRRWSRAPEETLSRAQYQPCVVAHAVARDVLDVAASRAEVARAHACDRRTVGRWVARVAALAEPGALSRRLLADSATAVVPAPPVISRPRRSAKRAALGLRAVWVLALLEALASVHGLAPPGLAHASRFMPALAAPTVRAPRADSGE